MDVCSGSDLGGCPGVAILVGVDFVGRETLESQAERINHRPAIQCIVAPQARNGAVDAGRTVLAWLEDYVQ